MALPERQPPADGPHARRQDAPVWRSAAIAALALALALGSLAIIWFLATPLAIFFVAIVIAEALTPVVRRVERWMPRPVGVVAIFLLLGLILAGLFLLIIPPLVVQTQQAIKDLPQLLTKVGDLVNRLAPGEGTRLVHSLEANAPTYLHAAAAPPLSALAALAVFVQIMFLAAYWLIATPGLYRFALSLFPPRQQQYAREVFREMGEAMGGYVRGTVLDAAIVAAITYVFLLLMGVRYPLVLALLAFLGEFVPLIGPTVAEIPAAGLALLLSPIHAIIVVVFYTVLQQVDGNVILPLILRSQAKISPLLVTAAVFTGAWVAGIVGALVAIPLAATLKVIAVRVVAPAIRHWSGAAEPERG
ncbi:MAG TPA: AI-2E family transporter [Chloroflexota bacterium]|nr:AI-2E family transporter [Chloroflexota bacterium]